MTHELTPFWIHRDTPSPWTPRDPLPPPSWWWPLGVLTLSAILVVIWLAVWLV